MPSTVIIGAQWGDESKGALTDEYAENADFVVRYQGGNNAGHTLEVNEETTILHLLPSGVLREARLVLGRGMAIDPIALLDEINHLQSISGLDLTGRILIDHSAQVLTPIHVAIDKYNEAKSGSKIGTTCRGIGPCYEEKARRINAICWADVRYWPLGGKNLRNLLARQRKHAGPAIAKYLSRGYIDKFCNAVMRLNKIVRIWDASFVLHQAQNKGDSILFEGAQGTFLDIDHGTKPFVTSSNPTYGGVITGTGVVPKGDVRVIGVVKAYTTRVGGGPFPTELDNKIGERLRRVGKEYGATTGRPRRCGWLDLPMLRYAIRINGFTELNLTKLDVLSGLKTIKLCIQYEFEEGFYNDCGPLIHDLDKVKPSYFERPGWEQPLNDIRRRSDLPKNARHYVKFIEDSLSIKISKIRVGPGRDQTIVR